MMETGSRFAHTVFFFWGGERFTKVYLVCLLMSLSWRQTRDKQTDKQSVYRVLGVSGMSLVTIATLFSATMVYV